MTTLKDIQTMGYKNDNDDMNALIATEKLIRDLSILTDGTGYKGNDGVTVTTYFTLDGVYMVMTNGLGINKHTGGMWNAYYHHRNTDGYKKTMQLCKDDTRGLIGNQFKYSINWEV